MSDVVRKKISDYFEALSRLDVEACLHAFSDDAVDTDPVGTLPVKGKGNLRLHFSGVTGLFQKLQFTQDHLFVSGTGAAVKWTARGLTQDGRQVVVEGIDVFEFNEQGHIRKLWGYWNPEVLMAGS